MIVYIDSKDIKYLKVNESGKITRCGLPKSEQDFENTYLDIKKLEVGKEPVISFNKCVLGDNCNWVKLNYKITGIKK